MITCGGAPPPAHGRIMRSCGGRGVAVLVIVALLVAGCARPSDPPLCADGYHATEATAVAYQCEPDGGSHEHPPTPVCQPGYVPAAGYIPGDLYFCDAEWHAAMSKHWP